MADRKKPATATAAGAGLAEQALSVLLTHSYTAAGGADNSSDADLLDVATLGALSIVSPHLLSLTQPAWRILYRRAVTAGSPAYAVETTTYLWRPNTLLNTWSGEDGLTPCFAAPHPAVISRLPGQYKTAAACLLTKTCAMCGEYAATANPLTFRRLCDDCTRDDVGGRLVQKSQAKTAFLLGEREGRIVEHGRATRAAKRQKTESSDSGRMTTRSSGRTSSGNTSGCTIPIGVMLDDGRMVGAVECKACDCSLRGSVSDIALHERLEHGMRHLQFDADPDMEFNTDEPEGLVSLSFDNEVLENMPRALKLALAEPEREFCRRSVIVLGMPGDGEHPPTPMIREMCSCTIKLDDEDVTVASDLLRERSYNSVDDLLAGNFDDAEKKGIYKLSCQLKPRGMAMELLRIGVGLDADVFYEAPLEQFHKLTAALGLPATPLNAAQLLASLILSSQPKEAFLSTVLVKPCDCGSVCVYSKGVPNDETPIFRTAIEIMNG